MSTSESSEIFDFVVVGGGPAGIALAASLARSAQAPKVLLLEAGGAKVDEKALLLAERFSTFINYPDYNWGYKTVPQIHLKDRIIDYSRGRGVGGSSRINFAAYTIGPKGDYDHWSELVGDDFFNWQNTRRRFNKIEAYETFGLESKKYIDIQTEHGRNGPIKVHIPPSFERGYTAVNDAILQCGIWDRNLDTNSGDPIGFGVSVSTGSKGIRSTALLYLENSPCNLTILSESPVEKIVFDGKRAIGAKVGAKLYRASKELIVSAGALDTPKLLSLSGIGPKDELSKHGIQCIHEAPGVGQNLRDHWFFPMILQLKAGSDDRPLLTDPDFLAAAQEQFANHGTGPLSSLYGAQQMGWFRPSEELRNSSEYKALSQDEHQHLSHPTVPTWELTTHGPPLNPDAKPDISYLSFLLIGMLPQSQGTITLASADPKDPPVCDPNLFSHPFDRRNAIEAAREAYKVLTSPELAEISESVFSVPKSMSDEDILDFTGSHVSSTWHMSCTAKMGKEGDDMAVVDTHFRVKGVKGLRVADMSITPFLPNCHTVSVAYLIGEMGAERLIEEYGLA